MEGPIRYVSTRGSLIQLTFSQALTTGIAEDGGLLVPNEIPEITDWESDWVGLGFRECCRRVLVLFGGEALESGPARSTGPQPSSNLSDLIRSAYCKFREPKVVKIVERPAKEPQYFFELFHGPTFSFKDVALQLLGEMLAEVQNCPINCPSLCLIGATSGDTGSAALAGVKGKTGIKCLIFYPLGRVSDIQERQMLEFNKDFNCKSIAVKDATFDDCQAHVKKLFAEHRELFSGVNSINWARIAVQIAYYVYAVGVTSLRGPSSKPVNFFVPTGNFGNILAAFYAKRMGVPIGHLVLGSNENDVLPRFLESGVYSCRKLKPTISPSMDIMVSSNFERLLWEIFRKNWGTEKASARVKALFCSLASTGSFTVSPEELNLIRREISGFSITETETLETIHKEWQKNGYLLCPHSAVGVTAMQKWRTGGRGETRGNICVLTADVGKFVQGIKEGWLARRSLDQDFFDALDAAVPEELSRLDQIPVEELRLVVRNDFEAIEGVAVRFATE